MLLQREPLWEKLKKQLLVDIETEDRQMLPNEKELMTRYGVSRNTLRRAVAELTSENILLPIQGIGTVIHPIPEIRADSRILVVCDRTMVEYQQEIFNKLLFLLNNSMLITTVLMLDKENVDAERFNALLKRSDAVIIDQLCSFSQVILDDSLRSGKKIICLRWKPCSRQISFVTEDVTSGFYLLAGHLLDLGHRDIAVLSRDPLRLRGIRRAMAERGLEFDETMSIEAGFGYREDGYRLCRELLRSGRRFTAIMGNSDVTALGIEEALLAAGKNIPGDIAVTGFDGLHSSANFPVPLTTCSSSQDDMIHEAIGYLFSSGHSRDLLKKTVESQLIIRDSTKETSTQTQKDLSK